LTVWLPLVRCRQSWFQAAMIKQEVDIEVIASDNNALLPHNEIL
jgi:hypothetical protein